MTMVHEAIAKALAFDRCVTCGLQLALVDAKKVKGEIVGGQWVHLHLPDSVHAPTAAGKRRLA